MLLNELTIDGRLHHRVLVLWDLLLVVAHILSSMLSRSGLPMIRSLLESVIDSAVIVDILSNDAHIL